jgi:hypothetical protein
VTASESSGHHLSHELSGELRLFAFWIANGTVGLPLLDGLDYWQEMRDSPSLLEQVFAIYANVIRLDDDGAPINAPQAQRRAAEWIRQYMTGEPPQDSWEDWEVALY